MNSGQIIRFMFYPLIDYFPIFLINFSSQIQIHEWMNEWMNALDTYVCGKNNSVTKSSPHGFG